MFVFIPGSILPVRFGLGGTDSPDRSISPVTYINPAVKDFQGSYTKYSKRSRILRSDSFLNLHHIIAAA